MSYNEVTIKQLLEIMPAASAIRVEQFAGPLNAAMREFGIDTPKRQAAFIAQLAHADQAAVTLGNTNGEIGGLTISAAYSQAEVQALRDKCEELADDVRALSVLLHQIRTDLIAFGAIKGSA